MGQKLSSPACQTRSRTSLRPFLLGLDQVAWYQMEIEPPENRVEASRHAWPGLAGAVQATTTTAMTGLRVAAAAPRSTPSTPSLTYPVETR